MPDLAALVLEPPAAAVGTPTGVGDWRVVVQVLLPANARAVVGTFRVGLDPLNTDVWTDMRDYVTGWIVTPGASDFGDHPSFDQLAVTFDSPDRVLSPWGPIGAEGSGHRFRAGCPIRVVLFDPVADVWYPLFTGEIDTADEVPSGNASVHTLAVTALDAVHNRLPQVDLLDRAFDPRTPPSSGVIDIIGDLLDEAAWPYGQVLDVQVDDIGGKYPIVGLTTLSGNLLDTLRRIGDSLGRQAGPDRFGRFAFVRRRPNLVTYSNAGTPPADPNLPPAVAIDTADVDPDQVRVVPAPDAIVNEFEATQLAIPIVGITGPAVIGEFYEPVRQGVSSTTVADATVRRGLQSSSAQSVFDVWHLHRLEDVRVRDQDSIDRFGLHRRSMSQVFPHRWTHFVGEQISSRLIELCADGTQLWRVTGIALDDTKHMDVISTVTVGSAATVDHHGATFTGHVATLSYTWQPLAHGCKLDVLVGVDAYQIERAAL